MEDIQTMQSVRRFTTKTLPVIRSISLSLFTFMAFGPLMTGLVHAQGGQIEVEILGHYTDDKENWDEEWTFEVQARDVPNLDEKDWRPDNAVKNLWTGDSDPNNNDWHDLEDKTLFRQRYDETLPTTIEIKQWGWEDDRGARWKYDCCHWYTNDDDSYGTGTQSINVASLTSGTWQVFDWPNLDNDHGIKVRARVIRAPEIKNISPNFGCRGDTDLHVTISGNNFPTSDDDLTGTIDWEGLVARNFHVVSNNEITARVDIGPAACLGKADVKIINKQLLLMPAVARDGFEIRRANAPGCAPQ